MTQIHVKLPVLQNYLNLWLSSPQNGLKRNIL